MVKSCAKLFYKLKYEKREVKIKDLAFFSSDHSPLAELKKINKIFANKKLVIKIQEGQQIEWLLDKYFGFDYPDDVSKSGLADYFYLKTDEPNLLHLLNVEKNEIDNEIRELYARLWEFQKFLFDNNLYRPERIISAIRVDDLKYKQVRSFLKISFIDTLQLHLAYLFLTIKFGSEYLKEFYEKKKLQSFRNTKTEDDLKQVFDFLITNKFLQEVTFSTFKKHFNSEVITEAEKLVWLKSNVLLAYLINSLKENDFLSVSENIWQKTAYCFKNQSPNSLKSSLNKNPYPKGSEKINLLFK